MLQFLLQELGSPNSRGQCESTAACWDLRERHPMPLCMADNTGQSCREKRTLLKGQLPPLLMTEGEPGCHTPGDLGGDGLYGAEEARRRGHLNIQG